MVLALTLWLSGCVTHELQSDLTEPDAQEIVVLLKDNGIDAFAARSAGEKKGEEKWSVSIRGGDQNLARSWRVLQENGLPRQKDKGLEDVFANPGMIPTATEEKARLLVGISGEISRTLKSISGIVDARVLVVLPENSPLHSQRFQFRFHPLRQFRRNKRSGQSRYQYAYTGGNEGFKTDQSCWRSELSSALSLLPVAIVGGA